MRSILRLASAVLCAEFKETNGPAATERTEGPVWPPEPPEQPPSHSFGQTAPQPSDGWIPPHAPRHPPPVEPNTEVPISGTPHVKTGAQLKAEAARGEVDYRKEREAALQARVEKDDTQKLDQPTLASATRVSAPTPTTGVAGTIAVAPGDAGALNPANVPPPPAPEDVPSVWVRFKQMAHIPPGRTVYPGEVHEIPEDHVHPDLHEKLKEDDEAIPSNQAPQAVNQGEQPHQADGIAPEHRHAFDWLHQRLQRVEREVFGSDQPEHAPPASAGVGSTSSEKVED